MKHNKYVSYPWYWSPRKEAALINKLQKEVDAMPLFSNEIRAKQPSVESIKLQRQQEWETREAERRADQAKAWRRARAMLFALPAKHRKVIRAMWNLNRWRTHEPHYLADLIHGYVVFGKRPGRVQIEKYGEAMQPVDYCSIPVEISIPPSKIKSKSVNPQLAKSKSACKETLSLFQ